MQKYDFKKSLHSLRSQIKTFLNFELTFFEIGISHELEELFTKF